MPQVPNTQVIDLAQLCTPIEGGFLMVKSCPSWISLQSTGIITGSTIQISSIDKNPTQITRSGNIVVEQLSGTTADSVVLKSFNIKIMQDGYSYRYEYSVNQIRPEKVIIEPNEDTVTLKWTLVKTQIYDNGSTGTSTESEERGGAEVGTNSDSANTRTITGVTVYGSCDGMGVYEVKYTGNITQEKNYKRDGDNKYVLITKNNPYQPSAETISYSADTVTPFIWAVENSGYSSESSTTLIQNGTYNVKGNYEDEEWNDVLVGRFQQYEDQEYGYSVKFDEPVGELPSTYIIKSYSRPCAVNLTVTNPQNDVIRIEPYVSGGTSISAITTGQYGPVEVTLTGENNPYTGRIEFVVRWYDLYRTTGTPDVNSIIGVVKVYKNGTLFGTYSGDEIDVTIGMTTDGSS